MVYSCQEGALHSLILKAKSCVKHGEGKPFAILSRNAFHL